MPVFTEETAGTLVVTRPPSEFPKTPAPFRPVAKKAEARIAGLDGLRAIAILAVLLAHAVELSVAGSPSDARWIANFTKLGPFGVRLFFAISGYLITSLFVKELEAHGPSLALRMFYIRRVFRIVPPLVPYLAVLALGGALSLLPVRGIEIARAGAFLGNYFPGSWLVNHFWSLAVEEHFYLFWPPLMALAGHRRCRWIGAAIVAAVAIMRTATLARHPAADMYWLLLQTHLILDFLVYAALAALLLRGSSIRRRLRNHAQPMMLAVLLGMLVVTNLLAHRIRVVDPRSIEAILFTLMVVLPTLRPEMSITRWLEHPALMWIGRRSYSMYLWQQLFLISLGVSVARNLELFVPRLIPIFLVAALSYRYLEQPMIRKGRELAQRVLEQRAKAADAAPVAPDGRRRLLTFVPSAQNE